MAGFSSGLDDASFLTTMGYCSAGRPFWTTREHPEAADLCCDLTAHIERMGDGTARLQSAKARLKKSNPVCPDSGPPTVLPPVPVELDWSDAEATTAALNAHEPN
jgi:hypothetical protein